MRSRLAALLLVLLAVSTVAAACASQRSITLRHISSVGAAAASPATSPDAVETSTLAAAPAAPIRVTPRPGDGWISLTARACGSSATWQAQRARNGGAAWLYLGRSYIIDCSAPAAVGGGTAPAPSSTWVRPLGGSWCFTPNGSREFGVWRGDHRHGGIDLGAPVGADYGDPIYAIHGGIAHHGYQAAGAGIYVWVDHGDGTSSWNFHMASRAVANGARVSAGQVIGYVGRSGNATAVHLHLETKSGGTRVDPVRFLADRGVRIRC